MTRTNHIFVDFENVQETDLDRIANKPVKVTLVSWGNVTSTCRSNWSSNSSNIMRRWNWCRPGAAARMRWTWSWPSVSERPKNPTHIGYFHIVSKDKDFDALIGHLNDNGTLAARRAAFREIPVLMNTPERVGLLASRFKANHNNRPKKLRTLESHIQAAFGKSLSPADVETIIKELIRQGILAISEKDEVAYTA